MNNNLISREELTKTIKSELDYASATGFCRKMNNIKSIDLACKILSIIDNAPAVEPFERIGAICNENCGYRPQGEWKFVFDDKVNNRFIYKCSECGREVSVYSSDALIPVYPFCHCGADMRKGGTE